MVSVNDSFQIRGFRGLPSLQLAEISKVNLFVGKNNTGKTTILEALRIFLSADPRQKIYNLLSSREEFKIGRRLRPTSISFSDLVPILSFESLFSGRPELENFPVISMGPMNSTNETELEVRLVLLRVEQESEEGSPHYKIIEHYDDNPDLMPGLYIKQAGRISVTPLDRMGRSFARRRFIADPDTDIVYLPSTGLTMREVGETWDRIALTDEEDDVVRALKLIAPDLDKIVLVQSPQEDQQRMLMAKLSTFSNPVPFRSLGEGTVHFLGLVLAMIQARNGVVLLDEVENGVHFSVQESMWDLIIQQSERLNVQVFATTHSWDCVSGFQAASQNVSSVTTRLFRLEKNFDHTKAVGFSPNELKIATKEAIEIR